MWIGRMPVPSAAGLANGCPRRRSGRKPRGGRTAAPTHGATTRRRGCTRISGKRIGTTMPHSIRSAYWKTGRVPMGFMIWPAMSGNGRRIGMPRTITGTAHCRTPKGQQVVKKKCCGAAPGSILRRTCDPRAGASIRRRTVTSTAGFGVRRLRSPWFLSPWSLVFF